MPFLVVLFILAVVTLFASVKIVQQQERGIVLRLGKYKSIA
ncbi:MAG: hypothetical protein US54_C0008G0001, partial [Candidatus Roizmanbacteria bacterium GW2011_GWA2_37_7]